jgi:hypothetical protein
VRRAASAVRERGWRTLNALKSAHLRAVPRTLTHLVVPRDEGGRESAKGRARFAQFEREPSSHRVRMCVHGPEAAAQDARENRRAVAHLWRRGDRVDRRTRPRAKEAAQKRHLRPRTRAWPVGADACSQQRRGAAAPTSEAVRLRGLNGGAESVQAAAETHAGQQHGHVQHGHVQWRCARPTSDRRSTVPADVSRDLPHLLGVLGGAQGSSRSANDAVHAGFTDVRILGGSWRGGGGVHTHHKIKLPPGSRWYPYRRRRAAGFSSDVRVRECCPPPLLLLRRPVWVCCAFNHPMDPFVRFAVCCCCCCCCCITGSMESSPVEQRMVTSPTP